ncbi:FHA domain-containing protein [Oryzihumus leptocrescens]|uniref:FHA domain-containing protein n=1 Tax=Oryzihumus leptocrescens TaxID=297536 RepID=A0A542ZIS0_9MICO|nr:FHA domain-containing protein [Oryzihumus leptocrescens]TQL60251.1 FHA domain-containing protein [Oryzihumus leptocrescens]
MSGTAPRALGEGSRVVVHPGSGVVHRSGDALLVMPTVDGGQVDVATDLLAACAVESDPTGRRRARRVAALLGAVEDPDAVPAFVLLLDTEAGPVLLASGDTDALVRGEHEQRVSGRDSLAWVEHRVEPGFTAIVLGGAAEPGAVAEAPVLPLDLAGGTVPGAGATVLAPTAGVAAGRPGPVVSREKAAPEEPVTDEPVTDKPVTEKPVTEKPVTEEPITEPVGDGAGRREPVAAQFTVMRPVTRVRNVALGPSATPARAPLPVAGAAADRAEAPTVDRDVVVEGLPCPQGHLNDPRASACSLCGSDLDPEASPVRATRPPLGVLVTDDGSVFLLTSDVVVGREPGGSEEVRSGRAQPLQLRDEGHSVSRVHARVHLDGWDVTVVDTGSANGTYLSRTGSAGPWEPVQEPTPLAAGDRLRLGKRQLMYDRHPAGPGR